MVWYSQITSPETYQQFLTHMNTPPPSAVAQLVASTDEASAFEAVLAAKQGR